jgi:hypothetical protein
MQVGGQVDVHEHHADEIAGILCRGEHDDPQQRRQILAEHFLDRRNRRLVLGQEGLELRRFFDVMAHMEREDHQRDGQKERNAPAPGLQLLGAGGDCLRYHHNRPQRPADGDPQRGERAEETTPAIGRRLCHERRSAHHFAAGEETLGQAKQHQQHRGGEADLRGGGQHADQRRSGAHADHGTEQHPTSSDTIGQTAQQYATDRAYDEGDAEHRQGGEQGRRRIVTGKEQGRDDGCHIAVDAELVIFHRSASRRSHGCTPGNHG